MKRRFLALASAVTLIFGMQMTAVAASPTAEELLAPRVDIVVDFEDEDVTVAGGDAEVSNPSAGFKVSVVEAVQKSLGEDVSIKSIVDVNGTGSVIFNVPGIDTTTPVKLLAYNNAEQIWEFLPFSLADNMISTDLTDYSKLVFLLDDSVTLMEESVALTDSIPVDMDSSALIAPRTGEMSIELVVILALGCVAVLAASKKKLAVN